MFTMILISSVAMFVGIVGSFFIWRFDALRADEIEHAPVTRSPAVLPPSAGEPPKMIS